MNSYLDPPAEFFDRAAVPPQIQELLDTLLQGSAGGVP